MVHNWVWELCKRSTFFRRNNAKDCCGCVSCNASGCSDKFPKKNIFESITQSPEVLTKELITTSYDEFKDCTVYWAWLGNGRREAYYSREEAYDATLAKLKEVEK